MNNKTQLTQLAADIKGKFYSITKSVSWFTLTVISGLLLSLVILVIHLFIPFEDDIYKKIVIEGGILSFSIAMISSLVIDYYIFSRQFFRSERGNKIAFKTFPAIIIAACLFLFLLCYLKPNEITFESMFYAQMAVFLSATIYAIVIKSCAFIKCM
jgi:preprotein translocase subunit Sec61beta